MENIDALKLAVTACAGLYAGGGIYCNVVKIPALFTVKDIVSVHKNWSENFQRGKVMQGGLGTLAIVTGGLAYYYDESEYRNLWAVGAGVMATVWPWTMFVMIPDINKLLQENVIEERGEKWVRDNIAVWNKRHMFRSFVGAVAYGTFLYGLYKSK